jgi:CheY-like chemotaxis protein
MVPLGAHSGGSDAPQPMHILLVEDDEVDAEVVARVLRREKIGNPFFLARDGVEALHLLQSDGSPQLPCLVLMDINMPRMDGFQLLAEMRKRDTLKENVVYMLTTSARDQDKQRAESMSAAGYITKENIGALVDVLRRHCKPEDDDGKT